MARAYSAMDYYFDHLKKTIASAPSGGTEFGEKVKASQEGLNNPPVAGRYRNVMQLVVLSVRD